MRRHKYNARATVYNGIKFDSLAEAAHYQKLAVAQKTGQIAELQVHPVFELQPAFTGSDGKKHRAIKYEADFSYFDKKTGRYTIEDVKGVMTEAFKIKHKLFLYQYQRAYDFRIIK